MKIEIKGELYRFEMDGTIGPVYTAERMLPQGERIDLTNRYHQLLVFWAVMALCNRRPPALEDFLGTLTTGRLAQMTAYFNRRWEELEPPADGGESPNP